MNLADDREWARACGGLSERHRTPQRAEGRRVGGDAATAARDRSPDAAREWRRERRNLPKTLAVHAHSWVSPTAFR